MSFNFNAPNPSSPFGGYNLAFTNNYSLQTANDQDQNMTDVSNNNNNNDNSRPESIQKANFPSVNEFKHLAKDLKVLEKILSNIQQSKKTLDLKHLEILDIVGNEEAPFLDELVKMNIIASWNILDSFNMDGGYVPVCSDLYIKVEESDEPFIFEQTSRYKEEAQYRSAKQIITKSNFSQRLRFAEWRNLKMIENDSPKISEEVIDSILDYQVFGQKDRFTIKDCESHLKAFDNYVKNYQEKPIEIRIDSFVDEKGEYRLKGSDFYKFMTYLVMTHKILGYSKTNSGCQLFFTNEDMYRNQPKDSLIFTKDFFLEFDAKMQGLKLEAVENEMTHGNFDNDLVKEIFRSIRMYYKSKFERILPWMAKSIVEVDYVKQQLILDHLVKKGIIESWNCSVEASSILYMKISKDDYFFESKELRFEQWRNLNIIEENSNNNNV